MNDISVTKFNSAAPLEKVKFDTFQQRIDGKIVINEWKTKIELIAKEIARIFSICILQIENCFINLISKCFCSRFKISPNNTHEINKQSILNNSIKEIEFSLSPLKIYNRPSRKDNETLMIVELKQENRIEEIYQFHEKIFTILDLDQAKNEPLNMAINQIQEACKNERTLHINTMRDQALFMKNRLILGIEYKQINKNLINFIKPPLKLEGNLLRFLGYKSKKFDFAKKKNQIYQYKQQEDYICENVLKTIKNSQITCCQDIIDILKKTGLKCRLEEIHQIILSKKDLDKFYQALICIYSKMPINFKKLIIPKDCYADKFPIMIRKLNDFHDELQEKEFNGAFVAVLRKLNFKDYFEKAGNIEDIISFFNKSTEWEIFEKEIEEQSDCISTLNIVKSTGRCKRNLERILMRLNFMQDFGPYIKYEFVQGGLDPNEVLGEGVCYAITLEFVKKSMHNPLVIDLPKPIIDSKIRYDQIALDIPDSDMKKEITSKQNKGNAKGYTIKASLSFFHDLEDTIIAFRNDFSFSNGWVLLKIFFEKSGHIIAYRIDEKNKQIALFDSNMGYFSFNEAKEGEIKLAKCIGQLIKMYYSDFKYVVATAISAGAL